MKRMFLIACLMIVAPCAMSQVYKCKGSNGETLYSQNPCTRDSKPHEIRGTKAATLTEAELINRQSVFKSTDLTDAGIAERNCIGSARSRIYGASDSRVAGYERQIQALNLQASRARNNLAGATYDAGIRNQIGSLQQSISTERSSADAQMSSATQRCTDARVRQDEAIERKYAPPKG